MGSDLAVLRIDDWRPPNYAVSPSRRGRGTRGMRADDQLGGVAELLQRWKGDEEALDALVPLVYKELRRLPIPTLPRPASGCIAR